MTHKPIYLNNTERQGSKYRRASPEGHFRTDDIFITLHIYILHITYYSDPN